MQYNKKYCPALVLMLRTVGNMRNKDICALIGAPPQSVGNIISKHGLANHKHYRDSTIDEIERDYLAGMSTYALADKYCVDRRTIGKWMKKRGHVRGKGYMPENCRCNSGLNKGHETQRLIAIEKIRERAFRDSNGTIELIEWHSKERIEFKCSVCGLIFTRSRNNYPITCPHCRAEKLAEEKEKREQLKEEHALDCERELAKDKICESCGSVFHSEYSNKKFCSNKCRTKDKINKKLERDRKKTALKQAAELKKDKTCSHCGAIFYSVYETKKYCDKCSTLNKHCDHRVRAERYGVEYDPTITIEEIIERDKNICQICGMPCDIDDKRWNGIGPLYPTQDHIIEMCNGGPHIRRNIQLAHKICNSIKGDRGMTEEVIAHAKEQAAAYKCA